MKEKLKRGAAVGIGILTLIATVSAIFIDRNWPFIVVTVLFGALVLLVANIFRDVSPSPGMSAVPENRLSFWGDVLIASGLGSAILFAFAIKNFSKDMRGLLLLCIGLIFFASACCKLLGYLRRRHD